MDEENVPTSKGLVNQQKHFRTFGARKYNDFCHSSEQQTATAAPSSCYVID